MCTGSGCSLMSWPSLPVNGIEACEHQSVSKHTEMRQRRGGIRRAHSDGDVHGQASSEEVVHVSTGWLEIPYSVFDTCVEPSLSRGKRRGHFVRDTADAVQYMTQWSGVMEI